VIKLGCDESLPNNWRWVEANDVMDVRDGTHDSPKAVDEGIPLVTSKNLVGGKVDFSTCNLISMEDHEAISKRSSVDDGDILYAMIGTIGNPVIVEKSREFSIKNVALFKFTKGTEVYNRYIYHFLNSNLAIRQFQSNSRGGTQKFVSLGNIRSLQIPLPPLEEQKRIAAILDKADSVRRKRQQAIDLADDFLRSVFLDMFGDPVTNPKGFPLSILSDFYINHKNGTKCGPFGSALKKHEYVEDGVPVWNMDNISLNGKFTDSPRLWITESKYVDLEAYSVEDGDVIISRAGTVGKMGVVRSKSEHSIISTNLIRVRLGEKLRPEYFVNLMNYCKGRVGRLKTGPDGSFTHMNTGILDKLEFPYPPIELQDKFIEIKEKVIYSLEKSEENEIDNLFNSLSQKAFSGDL
jgi:type I restriction enzyme S subunit